MLEHKYMIYSIQMSMRTMLPSPTVGLWQEQRVVKLWYDTGTVLGTSSHHHEKLKITELNSISSRILCQEGGSPLRRAPSTREGTSKNGSESG